MNVVSFIPEQLFLLVIALYILGMFCKQSAIIKDKFIPIILMSVSIIFSVLILGFESENILLGIISWGVATGGYDVINQMSKQ